MDLTEKSKKRLRKLRNKELCNLHSSPYTECNRIRNTTLKIYCDQTNSNITTQFLTEHLLTLQIFYKCSAWLPLVMRHQHDILINAIALIGVTFLDKMWDELEYRMDVCRITSGSHAEHL
jgi:hypothetical protein